MILYWYNKVTKFKEKERNKLMGMFFINHDQSDFRSKKSTSWIRKYEKAITFVVPRNFEKIKMHQN